MGYLRPDSRINAGITVVNVLGSAGGIMNSYLSNETISQWQVNSVKGLAAETTKPSTVSEGTLVIEDWFGKGWVGKESNCKSILKIANTATEAQLKEWELYMNWSESMRVIALNPSTGSLLTVTPSPNTGDPFFLTTGNKSTEGRLKDEGWTDEFFDSAKYWAPYFLAYENRKFTCQNQ